PEAVQVGKRGQSYMAPGARIVGEITPASADLHQVLAQRTAMPSWRDRGAHPEADVVVAPDVGRSSRNLYAVYLNGQMEGRFPRLDQAKAFVEQIFGPVVWERVKGDPEPHHDSTWGMTTEFNDAPYYWIVRKAPR